MRDEAKIVETLHAVGSALAAELELDRLVQTATDAATSLTGAAFGALFYKVVDAAGESSTQFTISGADRAAFEAFPMPRKTEVFGPTFDGQGVVCSDDITTDPRYGQMEPHFGMPANHLPVRSYLAVPVISRSGEVLGGLFFGHPEVAAFDARAEHLALGIAAQAATAIDNARLYAAARDARSAAEQSAARLGRLQAVTAALATAGTLEEVGQVAVAQTCAGLGATSCALYVRQDVATARLVASHGFRQEVWDRWRVVPAVGDNPLADALTTGETVHLADIDALARRYPDLVPTVTTSQAWTTVPVDAFGLPAAALTLTWGEPRPSTVDHEAFIASLAGQAGQAIERVRLLEAERAAAARQGFLADAARTLAGSLDVEATAHRVAELVVPQLAQLATVHLMGDQGLRLVAAASDHPDAAHRLRSALETARVLPGVEELLSPDDTEIRTVELPGGWGLVGRDEVVAARALPLVARGRVIGVLTAVPADDHRATRATLDEFAGRAAVALDNARLHHDRSEAAIVLQRSLLPPQLLAVPGLELAVRYHALAEESELGGDFYDVFRTGSGRWGVVIGDVCGKGVRAASLTALARYTLRAAALRDEGVAGALDLVNRALVEEEDGERFCTIAHLLVEPTPAGAHVQMGNAGHPLPYLARPGEPVRHIGATGPAAGLFEDQTFETVTFDLNHGDVLVLYTDGVTEARSPDGRFDPDLLPSVLADVEGDSADAVAERI